MIFTDPYFDPEQQRRKRMLNRSLTILLEECSLSQLEEVKTKVEELIASYADDEDDDEDDDDDIDEDEDEDESEDDEDEDEEDEVEEVEDEDETPRQPTPEVKINFDDIG